MNQAADEQEVKELNLLYKQLQKLIEDQDQFKSTLEEIQLKPERDQRKRI